jgi:hypothetical protein
VEHARFTALIGQSMTARRWPTNAKKVPAPRKAMDLRASRRERSEVSSDTGACLPGDRTGLFQHTMELRRSFGARDQAKNAAIAKKSDRTEGQPVGEMNSPQGVGQGCSCREIADGSVGAALAIGFRESLTIRRNPHS